MDVYVFVIVVVFIGCASGVVNNILRNQRQLREQAPDENPSAELSDLRARVEVLEKIVTDEKYNLTRELNALENQP